MVSTEGSGSKAWISTGSLSYTSGQINCLPDFMGREFSETDGNVTLTGMFPEGEVSLL